MSNSLKGKYICFTGKTGDFTRQEVEELCDELGIHFQKGITKKTDILVKGPDAGAVKPRKAMEQGIPVWSDMDFITMATQDDVDGIPESTKEAKKKYEENAAERDEFYANDKMMGMF